MNPTLTHPAVPPAAAVDPAAAPPIFLVGSERSGTTLLRLMLDHHPRIAFLFEFEYAVDRLDAAGRPPRVEQYRRYLAGHRIFNLTGFTADPALDYPALVDSFLRQKQRRDGKPLVGATVHKHFDHLPCLWPRAKYIHLLRDGRDVARSVMGMGWAGNLWSGGGVWLEAQEAWGRLQARVGPPHCLQVTYEDLVSEPRAQLDKVCAFLGVAFDEAMFSYLDESTYEPPDPKLAFQWKRKFSVEEIRLAEARMGDMLRRRGYELSGHPPLEVTPALLRQLQRQDRAVRRRRRIQTLGYPLWLASLLARRLHLAPLVRYTQRLENDAINERMR